MNTFALLIPHSQSTLLVQPRESSFDHPAVHPKAAAVLGVRLAISGLMPPSSSG